MCFELSATGTTPDFKGGNDSLGACRHPLLVTCNANYGRPAVPVSPYAVTVCRADRTQLYDTLLEGCQTARGLRCGPSAADAMHSPGSCKSTSLSSACLLSFHIPLPIPARCRARRRGGRRERRTASPCFLERALLMVLDISQDVPATLRLRFPEPPSPLGVRLESQSEISPSRSVVALLLLLPSGCVCDRAGSV